MLYRLRKAIEEPVVVEQAPVVAKETQIVEQKEPIADKDLPDIELKDDSTRSKGRRPFGLNRPRILLDADQVNEYLKWLKSKRLSLSPIEQRHGKLIFQSDQLYENFCEFVKSHNEAPISLHYFKRYIVRDPSCEFKSLRLNKERKSYLTMYRSFFDD